MRVTMRARSANDRFVTAPLLSVVPSRPGAAREWATPRGTAPAPAPVPFDAFAANAGAQARGLSLADARETLDRGRFATEYQAIVQARTGKTVAYEALGRFRRRDGRPISPARMFAVLHADPSLLLRTELTLKLHQVEHAPRAPLFVNLDPDSWARAGDRHRNPFLALFSSSSRGVVVEVTEALATADAARAQEMIGALRGRRLPIALDDVGAANGLLSFDAIVDAEVLKFDRTLIPRLRHPRCRALVQALTRMARETGAHSVLEGVETTTEFVLARDLGFDLVQGYLFRDRSRHAR
jgi:EAL domain-containing protein (putative c-di-GMP-specific phosphodiesterase class I)